VIGINFCLQTQSQQLGKDPLTLRWVNKVTANGSAIPPAALITQVDTYLAAQRGASAIPAGSEATLNAHFYTTTKATGNFATAGTKTGQTTRWVWDDGTTQQNNNCTRAIPGAGTRYVTAIWYDGVSAITAWNISSNSITGACPTFAAFTAITDCRMQTNSFTGALPSFNTCTALTLIYAYTAGFSGSLPSFSNCTNLVTFYVYGNTFTGALPSFNTCTLLSIFDISNNQISGTLPTFSACTALTVVNIRTNSFSGTMPSFATNTAITAFYAYSNSFTAITAGAIATQLSCTQYSFNYCLLPAAQINQILADLVVNQSNRPGNSPLATATMIGAGNGAPSGQGIVDKATLVTAGWTMTTN
jgi:hypothetical protein